ncbi:MAG: M23 family metallopeptidase [Acidobacteria bacterium]|nr:M23 family metallopeptidase [Acidobacteriota bacterium]
MKQQYFIVVLAHSLHGRLRRIHIPHHAVYAVLALALLGCFSLFGMVSSYLRMVWKVTNYNSLRAEVESLRDQYQKLEKSANQTSQHLANLQLFASEISLAYGIKRKLEGPADIVNEGRLVPTLHETLAEYDFLKTARLTRYGRNTSLWVNLRPALWPVTGRLLSYYGARTDPFTGTGAFHAGVDIAAPMGTPVRATADGTVRYAGYQSGYGRLLVVEHRGGVQTWYAHLSRFSVIPGQDVRLAEVIAYSGASGRATTPHLHYEVRDHGNPINPYKYLQNAAYVQVAQRKDLPF